MAQYKYREHLIHSSTAAFDTRHAPGTIASNGGIYRCAVCGEEILVCKGQRLPAETHHPHEPKLGKIEWQLLVFAEQRSDPR